VIKLQLSLYQLSRTHEYVWESGNTAPDILNRGTRWTNLQQTTAVYLCISTSSFRNIQHSTSLNNPIIMQSILHRLGGTRWISESHGSLFPRTSFRSRAGFAQRSVAQPILRKHSAPRNTGWMMHEVEEMSHHKLQFHVATATSMEP
jgi:hypothetical protein